MSKKEETNKNAKVWKTQKPKQKHLIKWQNEKSKELKFQGTYGFDRALCECKCNDFIVSSLFA